MSPHAKPDTDIIGLFSTTVFKAIEFSERTQNKGYYAVQAHRGWYLLKARIRN